MGPVRNRSPPNSPTLTPRAPMTRTRTALLAGLLLAAAALPLRAADENPYASDEATLRAGGYGVEGPDLLDFFRKRTLTAQDQDRLAKTVKLLGADQYSVREK